MLIIFDVDGTLIGGEEYDWKAFNDAFLDVTGRSIPTEFWTSLEEVTASAIVRHALSDLPVAEQMKLESRVRERCLENLKIERSRNPKAFASHVKTRALLRELEEHPEFDVAIATGDWLETIRFKLAAAEIELNRFVHATASDTPIRADIIHLAAQRSNRSLNEAVYIGDGRWDMRACRMLGIPFIGTGQRVESLKADGAEWIVETLETNRLLPLVERLLTD